MVEYIEYDDGITYINENAISKLIRIIDSGDDSFTVDEFINVYTIVYNMSLNPNNYSAQLYQYYSKIYDDYLNRVLTKIDNNMILQEIITIWNNHSIMIKWLSIFFFFLDKLYIPKNRLINLHDVAIKCFKNIIYDYYKEKMKNEILILVEQYRNNHQVDMTSVKNILIVFLNIGINSIEYYVNDFETYFIDATKNYYTQKAEELNILSSSEYLHKVTEYINKEIEMIDKYFSLSRVSTKDKILKILNKVLLLNKQDEIINKELSGFYKLLEDDKHDDLQLMFISFFNINSLELMVNIFEKFIRDKGIIIINELNDSTEKNLKVPLKDLKNIEQTYVENLIELYNKYHNYFDKNRLFNKALDTSFNIICNKEVNNKTLSEILSSYCDSLFKKNKSTDENISDNIIKIFKHIDNKDLFAEFYRRKLSNRLLQRITDYDNELEREIIIKFKTVCGNQFTSKMETMLNDLSISDGFNKEFKHSNFSTSVITTGIWPNHVSVNVNLSDSMLKYVESFTNFYQSKYSTRKLSWVHQLGICEISFKADRIYILVVNTYQAIVLLLFNDEFTESLNIDQIIQTSGLPVEDVNRCLESLCKSKIIIEVEKQYSINNNFKSKFLKLKIPYVISNDKKQITESVNVNRKYEIEAVIVRIMKSRKELTYQNLMIEIGSAIQLKGLDIRTIKSRIDDLISREFIERDRENSSLLKYIA